MIMTTLIFLSAQLVRVGAALGNWGVIVVAGHHWPRARENLDDYDYLEDDSLDNANDGGKEPPAHCLCQQHVSPRPWNQSLCRHGTWKLGSEILFSGKIHVYLHVEVDAGVLRKDGGEDLSEGLVGQDVVVIFEPLVKPAGPELAHQHRGVWSHSSDCFNL